jgi:hypothetical protein
MSTIQLFFVIAITFFTSFVVPWIWRQNSDITQN